MLLQKTKRIQNVFTGEQKALHLHQVFHSYLIFIN